MSKTIINIKSLTINVTADTAKAGFNPSLIGLLIHRALTEGANVGGEPDTGTTGEATGGVEGVDYPAASASPPAEATAAPTTTDAPADIAATAENIVAFLTSDPRYTLRTLSAIEKHFGANGDEAADIVDNLVAGGILGTKHQRGTGVTLYYVASAAASTATEAAPAGAVTESAQPAATPALTVENVRQFLQSDERYTQRTIESVAKFFNVSNDEAAGKLEEMDDDGDVRRTTRRSDGAALYQVA